jgi:hypothetical protein
MDKRKLITVGILFILWDRVEFLYYLVEGRDTKIGFLMIGDPIRIDSYVYFASMYFQTVIIALILQLVLPLESMKYFLIACLLCFLEYFVTYGRPIAKIPLPWELYIPVSCSTLRLLSVCYVMWDCVKRYFDE